MVNVLGGKPKLKKITEKKEERCLLIFHIDQHVIRGGNYAFNHNYGYMHLIYSHANKAFLIKKECKWRVHVAQPKAGDGENMLMLTADSFLQDGESLPWLFFSRVDILAGYETEITVLKTNTGRYTPGKEQL